MRELYETICSFPLSFIWNVTKPIPIKEETTVKKTGWFLMGDVSVTFFLLHALVC